MEIKSPSVEAGAEKGIAGESNPFLPSNHRKVKGSCVDRTAALRLMLIIFAEKWRDHR